MKQKKFSGVVVPMITPLCSDYSIDKEAVGRIMASFAGQGISPLVLGTTGESASVSPKPAQEYMEAAIAAKAPHQKVYAGLVGNDVPQLLKQARLYASLGADAVVSTLPSYYVLTTAQMRRFYLDLAEQSTAPVLMYNIKATTQMSIPLELSAELSEHPNIAGLKDSERDLDRLKQSIELFKDREDFSFFCGWGAQCAASLLMGADGIVPSTGNIVPECYGKLYQAYLSNDEEAVMAYQAMTDKVGAIYQKGRTLGESLAALKVLMQSKALCGTTMMPPLSSLTPEEAEKVLVSFAELEKEMP